MPSRQEILYQINALPLVSPETHEVDPGQLWVDEENSAHFRVAVISSPSRATLVGLIISGNIDDQERILKDFKGTLGEPILTAPEALIPDNEAVEPSLGTTYLWQPTRDHTEIDLVKVERPFTKELTLDRDGPCLLVNSEIGMRFLKERDILIAATKIWSLQKEKRDTPTIYKPSSIPRGADMNRVDYLRNAFTGKYSDLRIFVGLDYAVRFLESGRMNIGLAIDSTKPLNLTDSPIHDPRSALRHLLQLPTFGDSRS